MRTSRAAAWPRTILALIAMSALVLAVSPVAGAQEAEEPEQDTGVECDAEYFELDPDEVEELEELGFPGIDRLYFAEPGQEVECEAWGLDTEETAYWRVRYYDLEPLFEDEEWDEEDGFGEPMEEQDGETVEDHDGTIVFSFVPPEGLRFGLFEGLVWQGDEDPDAEDADLTYEERFLGIVSPEFFEGDMSCAPDPAAQGSEVECVAEDMEPEEEFWWEVHFLSLREFVEEFFGDEDEFEGEFDEFDEEFFAPDIQGEGTADEDGFGVFSFDVPAEGDIDIYLVFAEQEEYFAMYIGEVVPAEAEEEEEHAEPEPQPQPVQRPTRVETGAGGGAPGGTVPIAVILGSLLAAAAVGMCRSMVRG